MNIAQLKALNTDRLDIEEAVSLSAFAGALQNEFESHGLATPDWLTDAQKRLSAEITAKARDQLEAELKRAKAKRETLKTAAEQRTETDARIAQLEKRLGIQ